MRPILQKNINHKCDLNDRIYNNYRNALSRLLRKSKREFCSKKFEEVSECPAKRWCMIKEVLQQPSKTIPLEIVNEEGEMPKSADDVSEVFGNYFSAVGKRVTEGICPMLHDPSIFDYLGSFWI